MIDSKNVIKRLEGDPEINFSTDKSLMPIAHTIKDWLDETQSETKTVERILTHQTLNDYEKIAGIFFLGSLIASHVFAAIGSVNSLEGFIEQIKEATNERKS